MNKNDLHNLPWQEQLEERAYKIHVIACKVAVVAVPAFFITDVFISPDRWKEFLSLRLLVAFISLGLLVARRWMKIWDTMLAFIPFVLVSLLNAYMWSTMDVKGLQMHTFSYIALFLAGGMLLLWRPHYTKKVVLISIALNVLMFSIFSPLSFSEIMTNGGALTLAVALFSVVLMDGRYRSAKEEIISRLVIDRSKREIEEKNKEILDSISYAKRIQQAILPPTKLVKASLTSSFIFYRAKDIVAGDFYWFSAHEDEIFFAAADCTGHGVPGAMVSVVCANALNRTVNEMGLREPALILDRVRELVVQTFEKSEEEVKDGMDISFCRLNVKTLKLSYAGAHNSLYRVTPLKEHSDEKILTHHGHMLLEYKGDKQPIGKYAYEKPFKQQDIQLLSGDSIYISTDGFPDQFGGALGRKYMYKRFKQFFLSIHELDPEVQKERLQEEFETWRGTQDQVDDVCVIGVKLI